MSITGASSNPGEGLVSSAERTGFVEAVLAGNLEPDFSAVAYHFEGWLDKDVVDAVFEVSSGPTEAVSALAGMFPPEKAPDDNGTSSTSNEECPHSSTTTSTQAAAASAAAAATPATTPAADPWSSDNIFLLLEEDPPTQPGPPSPLTAIPLATPAAEKDQAESPAGQEAGPDGETTPATSGVDGTSSNVELAGTLEDTPTQLGAASPPTVAPATPAAEEDQAESPAREETGSEEEAAPAAGGVDGRSSTLELEKVAAFIASYAGEQEAAAAATRARTKPPEPQFSVPRGISVPSTGKVRLVIAKTAEKAVELPGFEAFMKMQHGKDTLFRFLSAEHALHSYYLLAKKHVQETVMKGGKAKDACIVNSRDTRAANDKTEDPDVAEIMRMLGGVGP